MLGEGRKLKACENKVLKRKLEHQGRGINRRIEKITQPGPSFFYSSPCVINVVESRRKKRAGHAHKNLDMSKDCLAENLKTEI